MRLKISALIMGLVVALSGAGLAEAESVITQVTHNTYEDLFPQIKGDCLVWQGRAEGIWEVFLYNIPPDDIAGGVPVQISDDSTDVGCGVASGCDSLNPQTDGRYVVWWVPTASGGEIWLYDKDTPTGDKRRISPESNACLPVIANGRVAWMGSIPDSEEDMPNEVFLYDLNDPVPVPRQLTDNSTNNQEVDPPRINDYCLMWIQRDQDDADDRTVFIHHFGPGDPTEAPAGFRWEGNPREDGNLKVSSVYDGLDWEIVKRGGCLGFEQITDNRLDDRYPHISEGKIAWVGGGEIFLAEVIDPCAGFGCDVDADGACGDFDNCPRTANPDQSDNDLDGVGNACDNCPDDVNPDQADADSDGIGDVCDLGVVLIRPANDAVLPSTPRPTFEWTAVGYDRFKVQFCKSPNFPRLKTLTFGRRGSGWLSTTSFTPTRIQWNKIKAIARRYGYVYWRVKAAKAGEGIRGFSETRRFTVENNMLRFR